MIHFPEIPVLGFARDDKGEELKEDYYCSCDVTRS